MSEVSPTLHFRFVKIRFVVLVTNSQVLYICNIISMCNFFSNIGHRTVTAKSIPRVGWKSRLSNSSTSDHWSFVGLKLLEYAVLENCSTVDIFMSLCHIFPPRSIEYSYSDAPPLTFAQWRNRILSSLVSCTYLKRVRMNVSLVWWVSFWMLHIDFFFSSSKFDDCIVLNVGENSLVQ